MGAEARGEAIEPVVPRLAPEPGRLPGAEFAYPERLLLRDQPHDRENSHPTAHRLVKKAQAAPGRPTRDWDRACPPGVVDRRRSDLLH